MKTLFKVMGVLHALGALVMGFSFVVMLVVLVTGSYANAQLAKMGEATEFSIGYVIAAMIISGLLALMYVASSFGFFKMKKWQPIVFSGIVVLSVVELIVTIVMRGFAVTMLGSAFFILVWAAVAVMVWMKKDLFKN